MFAPRILYLLVMVLGLSCTLPAAEVRGLPFMRSYSLDEVGKVSRAARLGFDSFGRFAVMYDGIYTVLNDTAWVDQIDPAPANRTLMTIVRNVDGVYYFGGRASWGIAERTSEGLLRAKPLVPPDAPEWAKLNSFSEMLAVPGGVLFYEINGIVFLDTKTFESHFFPLPRIATCFRAGGRVFVSSHDRTLREFDPHRGRLLDVNLSGLTDVVVERAAPLDGRRTLLALQGGRLVVFDGTAFSPWMPQETFNLNGRVMALAPLAEGGVAIYFSDQGLLLFSDRDALKWRLPQSEFRLGGALTANEPGVLWAMGENAIHKIYYDSPLTSFGPLLGSRVVWPRVVMWAGRLVICSGGTAYVSSNSDRGTIAHFRPLAGLAEGQISTVASEGGPLLAADGSGVLQVDAEGLVSRVIAMQGASKIVFSRDGLCFVIGSREIAVLQSVGGKWVECAPRVEGVGDAPVRATVAKRIWLEMGSDKVTQLSYEDGRIRHERVQLPWSGGTWTNVGVVGSTVILSGACENRAFYDEDKSRFVDEPRLSSILDRSPHWITRVTEDQAGTLWATHSSGIVTFTPKAGDYVLDANTFDLRNDSYPEVILLPGNQIWINSGRSLYHVEPRSEGSRIRPNLTLVSMLADQRRQEMLPQANTTSGALHLPFENNSLIFRFFSGTYAWRLPPLYEYRLSSSDSWTPVDSSMTLRFPKLRHGDYHLEVRDAGGQATGANPFALAFTIDPPWYRTPTSYGVAVALMLTLSAGVLRWMHLRAVKRNAALEQLVKERTKALEATMQRLNDETRNAATLAERSRLAGEIHDSLQQGLCGTLLHLETTLTHPELTQELRSQLSVMRNMLSYSREEVQQAVWNLESPLLQNSTLGEALTKLVNFINVSPVETSVSVPDSPIHLAPEIQHNLLRIAQEAITNAVKHAQASHVGVVLRTAQNEVQLTVTDNGKGFDVAAGRRREGHFGLRGIEARAKSILADLQIASAPGAGTSVHVTLKFKETAV